MFTVVLHEHKDAAGTVTGILRCLEMTGVNKTEIKGVTSGDI